MSAAQPAPRSRPGTQQVVRPAGPRPARFATALPTGAGPRPYLPRTQVGAVAIPAPAGDNALAVQSD